MSTPDGAGWPDLAGRSDECREGSLLGQVSGRASRHWDCTDPACACTCLNCKGKTR